MKPRSNPLLRASRLALIAITFGALPTFAGTTWDGGGADTNLGTGANWNVDDLAPAFTGTQNVTFSTAGTIATVAPAGNIDFNSITLNQTSGFTIQSGAGTLRVKGTTTSSTANGCINASGSTEMTISAPLVVSTVGTIFNVNNTNSAATGLTLSGGLSASSGTYSFRLGGSGKTVISGTVTGVNGIQQSASSAFTGTVVFDCNLAAAGGLNIPSTGSGTVTAAKIQMGTSTSQTQSWTSSAITQNSTIIVNSTATMTTLAIGAAASAGSNGATVEVGGSLSGTTLTVGGATYTGNLKVSGTASFSGALATGSLAGSKIVGNDVSNGTLKLSSGTNLGGATSTVIGGAGSNENNINLEKISSGTLTLTGTNPYTGSTTVTAGILDITAATLSGTTALTVGASGTLGLSVSAPSTIPGTASFTAGSKVKLTGTAADGAVIMTASTGMSGTAPTLDPAVPGFITEISGTQLKLKAFVAPAPLNTWDAGAAPDTNINTAANWGLDTLPASTASVTFGDAGSTATVNVDTQFAGVTFNRAAAFNVAGASNLILSSVNSGASTNLVVSSFAGGAQTIDAPLQVDTTNTVNKFLSLANNSTTHMLDINGSISRTPGSSADYAMRFQNAAGSVTRIDGALNNISGVQQGFSGTVAGDLIFGGNRSSTASLSIGTTASGVAPATTARLFLGETTADSQTWGNLSLQNTMKLVVGGNITAGTISVGGNATAANTRIVGNSATNSTLSLTGGTISNLATLGGAGTNENNLSLVMAGSGTLTISGGTHTYTGGTTVNSGTLSVTSGVALPSAITVNAGSTLAGEGSTAGTLAFGGGNTSIAFDPATSGSFTANSVDLTGTGTIYVSPISAMTNGTPYVVLTRSTGTFSGGDLAKFALTTRGGALSLTGGGTEITLTAAPSTPASLVWKGNAASPTFWDAAITQNWTNLGSPDRFYTDDDVTFDNSASSFTVNVQGSSVLPGNMAFSNNLPNNYTIGGGTIGGSGSLTKSGTGTVTLTQAGTNSFSGSLAINAGTLSISNLNQIGGGGISRAIELGGGTLQYTYNATAAQTSNTVPLTLNSGTSTFEITGSVATGDINGTVLPVTLRLGGAVTGGGDLIKSGVGTLSLGLNSATTLGSTFTGTVLVTGGALDIRNSDSLGDIAAGTTISNASLEIFPFDQNAGVTFAAEPLTLSGTSYLRMKNEDTNSDIENTWTGAVTVSAGAVVGISAPKQASLSSTIANTIISISPNISKLDLAGSVSTAAGSVLKLGLIPASITVPAVQSGVAQTIAISGALTGSGSVETQGASTSVYTLTAPAYSGNTTVNGGTLKLDAVNANNESSTVTVATDAKIDIAFSGNDTVAALVLGGTSMGPGTYNATTHPAFFTATGSGSIVVPAAVSGYSAWQTANSAGVQTVDQDHDNDGVDNGVEYFLGGNTVTTGFTPLPGVVANTVTWVKSTTYTGAFGTGFKVQSSTNLSTWTDASAGAGPGQVNIVSNNVTYTLPTGAGKTFVRLLVNPN